MIIDFDPFPVLITERLNLRRLRITDEKEILFLRSDKVILKFLDITKANNLNDARKYIRKMNSGVNEKKWIIWGITLKQKPDLIGSICLWKFDKQENSAEIGYVLHPHFQGKGIMGEALENVCDFGFHKMKLHSIKAELNADNQKSIKLLQRNGFIYDRKVNNMVVYISKKM